jgi:hypothetical protein
MVVQSVAWTTMLAENLLHESPATALERTFDGKHPCRICKAIAARKKDGRKNELPGKSRRLEYPANRVEIGFRGPPVQAFPEVADQQAEARLPAPPCPPPRHFRA